MTLFIVLLPVLVLGALNGSATAAVGLVAPGLQTIHLPGEGIVIDPNTHVPGLVGAKTPRSELTVRPDPQAAAHVAELKADLRAARAARARASVAVGVILGLLALLAAVTRSRVLARAAVLYAPAAIALGLAWRSSLAIGFGALALALVAGVSRRAFVPLLVVRLRRRAARALALARDERRRDDRPACRRRPSLLRRDESGRDDAARARRSREDCSSRRSRSSPIGWSKAGADGGGLVTYAAGYAMHALRPYGRITPRRVAVAAGDRRRGRPPARRARRGDRRLESRHACARRRPARRSRPPLARVLRRRDAQRRRLHHVRLGSRAARSRRARSPAPATRRRDARRARRLVRRERHAAGRRALGSARRDRAPRVASDHVSVRLAPPMRRLLPLAALALVLAGCGGGTEVTPDAGDGHRHGQAGADAAPPRARRSIDANGCGGCHTYKPAASAGKVGPDLDNLAADATEGEPGLARGLHARVDRGPGRVRRARFPERRHAGVQGHADRLAGQRPRRVPDDAS